MRSMRMRIQSICMSAFQSIGVYLVFSLIYIANLLLKLKLESILDGNIVSTNFKIVGNHLCCLFPFYKQVSVPYFVYRRIYNSEYGDHEYNCR